MDLPVVVGTLSTLQDWFMFDNEPMLSFFCNSIQSGILSLRKAKQTFESESHSLHASSS